MRRIKLLTGFGISLLLVTLLVASSVLGEVSVGASDGGSRVVLPAGWTKLSDIHEKAELEVGSRANNEFMIVLTEAKDDFVDLDLPRFGEATRELLVSSLSSVKTTKPRSLELNGMKGLQVQIQGASDNLKIVYLHTVLEGTRNYFQIIQWTLRSRFEIVKPRFDSALKNFTETK